MILNYNNSFQTSLNLNLIVSCLEYQNRLFFSTWDTSLCILVLLFLNNFVVFLACSSIIDPSASTCSSMFLFDLIELFLFSIRCGSPHLRWATSWPTLGVPNFTSARVYWRLVCLILRDSVSLPKLWRFLLTMSLTAFDPFCLRFCSSKCFCLKSLRGLPISLL